MNLEDIYDYFRAPTYIETLPNGRRHEIVEIDGDKGVYANTGVFEVPDGHYFVLGDNRANPNDSRSPMQKGGLGYVAAENILGKADTIYWSRDRDRILTPIQ